jgi:hypothetical protein
MRRVQLPMEAMLTLAGERAMTILSALRALAVDCLTRLADDANAGGVRRDLSQM